MSPFLPLRGKSPRNLRIPRSVNLRLTGGPDMAGLRIGQGGYIFSESEVRFSSNIFNEVIDR